MEVEVWKDLERFNGQYQVSNIGRVRSLKQHPAKVMKLYNSRGYYGLTLRDNNKNIYIAAHRLVALAFIPNPDNKPFINHIDGNRSNNHVSNLEWCTPQENSSHAVKIGAIKRGEESSTSILTEKEVIEIKKSTLSTYKLASVYGMERTTIGKIKQGKLWAHVTICLLLISFVASAQTVTLPTWLADSMIFEVQKGRQCSVVLEAQSNELEKQGRELIETGTALRLSQNESKSLQGLVENAAKDKEADKKQYDLDKRTLKRKLRNRTLVILGESVLITLILIL